MGCPWEGSRREQRRWLKWQLSEGNGAARGGEGDRETKSCSWEWCWGGTKNSGAVKKVQKGGQPSYQVDGLE